MGRALVSAINGNVEDRAEWVAAHVSVQGLKQRDAEAWRRSLDHISDIYGRLELAGIETAPNGTHVSVKLPDGVRAGRIVLRADPAEPARVVRMASFPQPALAPASERDVRATRQTLLPMLKARIDRAVRNDELSGVVLVMKGDEVVVQRVAGLANRDFGVPNSLETRFHLGSMDKMFTGVLIAQLIEAGKLSLDTHLVEVLPDYPNKDAAAKITIRHLLTHSAGLGMVWERKGYNRLKPYERVSELLPIFAAEPLNFEPGERGDYSNEGFAVLGAVVEKLTGRSWYDVVRTNVFDRAGMRDTGYPRIDEVTPGRAVGYRFGEEDPLGLRARTANTSFVGYRGNSFGGGYSTAADITAFLRALAGGRLVKPESFAMMRDTNGVQFPGYGHGIQVQALGTDVLIGHDGGGPTSGINSDGKLLLRAGYTIAVLGNYDAPFTQALAGDLARMIEQAVEGRPDPAQQAGR